jgi:hypothetical protein
VPSIKVINKNSNTNYNENENINENESESDQENDHIRRSSRVKVGEKDFDVTPFIS